MKLYYAPWACSLADHIALLEMSEELEIERVNIHTKRTESGRDFREINAKGYVPALVLDDGATITENIAILDWIADKHPMLRPAGSLARTRLIEALSFIATEIHNAFKPFWHGGTDAEKQAARDRIAKLFELAAAQMRGEYLFGNRLSVADCYLFVTLRWAERFGVPIPEALLRLQWRMDARPAVQAAIAQEEHSTRQPFAAAGRVTENSQEHRFERLIHDDAIAAAYYRDAGGNLAFIHTEVPTEFSGLGIATELARGTFENLRRTGRKAILICPFMVHFSSEHPEYADVIAA